MTPYTVRIYKDIDVNSFNTWITNLNKQIHFYFQINILIYFNDYIYNIKSN